MIIAIFLQFKALYTLFVASQPKNRCKSLAWSWQGKFTKCSFAPHVALGIPHPVTCTSRQWSLTLILLKVVAASLANSIYCAWLHFLVNETANYLSLHSTENFTAKAKIKFCIEKRAKTHALILLRERKESRCHYFLWGSETLKKFVRRNWMTHTDQCYTWERDVIQTQDTQKCT